MRALLTAGLLATLTACGGTLPGGWSYVTRVSTTAATVVWTGGHATSIGCRGPDGKAWDPAASKATRGLRFARLEGLAPGSRYTCRLRGLGDRRARTLHFRTAPARDGHFVFAVVGDSGDGSRQAGELPRRILASHPAFLIHLGDMAYPNAYASTLGAKFFRPYQRLLSRVPLFPTPGNHDLGPRRVYATVFAPVAAPDSPGTLYYAFDWGDAHFDSIPFGGISGAESSDARWLADDLARAAERAWRIVFLHKPTYSSGRKRISHHLRRSLQPIVEAGDVDLVLAGHQHAYERSRPLCEYLAAASVLEVISGGGGHNLDRAAPQSPMFPRTVVATHFLRVSVTPDEMTIRAIGLRRKVLDRVRLRRGQAAPCHPGPAAR